MGGIHYYRDPPKGDRYALNIPYIEEALNLQETEVLNVWLCFEESVLINHLMLQHSAPVLY